MDQNLLVMLSTKCKQGGSCLQIQYLTLFRNPAQILPGNTHGTTVFIRDNLKVVTNKVGDIITVMWQ